MRTHAARALSALSAAGLLLLGAGPAQAGHTRPEGPQYIAIDVGTFGGPNSELDGPAVQITNDGTVLGTANTTITDNDYPSSNPFLGDPSPVLRHGFSWKDGHLRDLGALPGNNSSAVFEMNARGVGAGISETGAFDTRNGYPAEHAVLFTRHAVADLGTLPGGIESQAVAINDRGQVAGFGDNGIPDPYSMLGFTTQTRAFIWQNGAMRDLGTLGGPDAITTTLNARGQIAGDSYTDTMPNPATGSLTSHPFLWTAGHMRDLGTLGGTQSGTTWLNSSGQVVGQGNLAGDQTAHPFLWDGRRLRDLGTLGGDFGTASHINDAGHITGLSTPPGNTTVHAFLWKNGTMTDLTGADNSQCTYAEAINERDQVVGGTCDGSALLWSGGRQFDLNDLAGTTDIHLTEADYINDRGQITAMGTLPNGNRHVFMLTPTSQHRSTSPSRPSRQSPTGHATLTSIIADHPRRTH